MHDSKAILMPLRLAIIAFANVNTCLCFFYLGQKLPDMTLIRQHLMLEGLMDKSCLVDIVHKVTAVFSKFLIFKSSKSSGEKATETIMETYQFFLFLSDHRGRAKLIEGVRASDYYWRHPWTVL